MIILNLFEFVKIIIHYLIQSGGIIEESQKEYALIIPLYGLWKINRKPKEQEGYELFLRDVVDRIHHLYHYKGREPQLIILAGGTTQTWGDSTVSESSLFLCPLKKAMRDSGLNLSRSNFILVHDSSNSIENIVFSRAKLIENSFLGDLFVISDEHRIPKFIALSIFCLSHLYRIKVLSCRRPDINPNSNILKQLAATARDLQKLKP
jgi:hypothetical protein